ncbi:MAG: hypothetical protein IJ705_05865 [Oscillospiraceae bacterium]|nr:hypothetical protein [Oscillospiraceae bacterium]
MNRNMMQLQDEDLNLVSGGTGSLSPEEIKAQEKYHELLEAWNSMGFPEHGFYPHQLGAICDEWRAGGYKGTARQVLQPFKNW